MVIMWGFLRGAEIYGAKVVFVKKVDFGVRLICCIPWCMVQTTKTNPRWIVILWCKPPKPIQHGLRLFGAKHQSYYYCHY